MFLMKRYKIRSYEMGLLFRDGEFRGLRMAGVHWFFDPLGKIKVDIVSQRDPWLTHEKLDLIVKSGTLKDRAIVLDLKDHERALVWIENRFSHVLPAGLYAYWTGQKNVRVEVVDARNVRFQHDELKVIARSSQAQRILDICTVERDKVGVLFIDGRYVETLTPGLYAFWKGQSDAKVVEIDLR
ncbi:MAG TPA: slipin family protein, partial [Planctomicrobium sp.]|nr:slipin family protein [Planctomicrobium sp.]